MVGQSTTSPLACLRYSVKNYLNPHFISSSPLACLRYSVSLKISTRRALFGLYFLFTESVFPWKSMYNIVAFVSNVKVVESSSQQTLTLKVTLRLTVSDSDNIKICWNFQNIQVLIWIIFMKLYNHLRKNLNCIYKEIEKLQN